MQSMRDLMDNIIDQNQLQEQYQAVLKEIFAYPEIKVFINDHTEELDRAMIENSVSKLNEFMNEMDLYKAGKQGQNPGFKPELFINVNYIDVSYIPTEEYLQFSEKRYQNQLLDNRMMSHDVRQASLKDFSLESPERQQLMSEVIDFIQQFEEDKLRAQGLYITGPFGVGKTFLLGALANALVKKHASVTMLHYPTFTTEIKATISENTTQSVLNKIKQVDVLMLDDIGAEVNTVWVRDEVLNTLLEYRMKESLPTFFTSNFSMKELETHLAHSRNGEEGLKAKRLMERIRFLTKEIKLGGENRRHHRG